MDHDYAQLTIMGRQAKEATGANDLQLRCRMTISAMAFLRLSIQRVAPAVRDRGEDTRCRAIGLRPISPLPPEHIDINVAGGIRFGDLDQQVLEVGQRHGVTPGGLGMPTDRVAGQECLPLPFAGGFGRVGIGGSRRGTGDDWMIEVLVVA